MKKSQFNPLDYAVVEKLKAPIEKFNTDDDLQDWAKERACQIAEKDFGGRQEETKIQRKAMLKEWSDYVLKGNDAYNSTTALLDNRLKNSHFQISELMKTVYLRR